MKILLLLHSHFCVRYECGENYKWTVRVKDMDSVGGGNFTASNGYC